MITQQQIEEWRDTGSWPDQDFPDQVLELFNRYISLKDSYHKLSEREGFLEKEIARLRSTRGFR